MYIMSQINVMLGRIPNLNLLSPRSLVWVRSCPNIFLAENTAPQRKENQGRLVARWRPFRSLRDAAISALKNETHVGLEVKVAWASRPWTCFFHGRDARATMISSTSRQAQVQGKENGNPGDHLSVVESLGKIDAVWDELYPGEQNRIDALLIRHIEVGHDRVTMTIKVSGLEQLLGLNPNHISDDGTVEIVLPVKCRRVCGRTRLIGPKQSPEEEPTERNETLEAIARAFAWQEALESGKVASISELATAEGVDESFLRRQLSLALMEPMIAVG